MLRCTSRKGRSFRWKSRKKGNNGSRHRERQPDDGTP
jgi:hypothetical protein